MARITPFVTSEDAPAPACVGAGGRICLAHELIESGRGVRFMLNTDCGPRSAFVIRYAGGIYGYLNKCAHRSVELDWNPGEFFDVDGQLLICATHGARYHPVTGACVSGPCAGQGLDQINLDLVGDEVRVACTARPAMS
ncbi:MAG: Rieske (2Fe-2S) protein [Acidiferrobacterales bacterium]